MDFHAAMETFAEAWVAANTQTAVNTHEQAQRTSTMEEAPSQVQKEPKLQKACHQPPGQEKIVPSNSGVKSLPIHCVIEQTSGPLTFDPESSSTSSVELDSYAILPSTTLISELVRSALIKLGYNANEAMNAKGAIQIKNWKPLSFETITEDCKATVEDILGELTQVAKLRIRLSSPCKLSSTDEIKGKLLQLLLTQSQGILMNSGCPIEKDFLTAISKGDNFAHLPFEIRRSFDKWYHDVQKQKDQRSNASTPEKNVVSPQQDPPHPSFIGTHTPLHGKTRMRTSFDPEHEIPRLQKWFSENQHPPRELMIRYLEELNSLDSRKGRRPLDLTNIIYWFKNARAAHRRASRCFDGENSFEGEDINEESGHVHENANCFLGSRSLPYVLPYPFQGMYGSHDMMADMALKEPCDLSQAGQRSRLNNNKMEDEVDHLKQNDVSKDTPTDYSDTSKIKLNCEKEKSNEEKQDIKKEQIVSPAVPMTSCSEAPFLPNRNAVYVLPRSYGQYSPQSNDSDPSEPCDLSNSHNSNSSQIKVEKEILDTANNNETCKSFSDDDQEKENSSRGTGNSLEQNLKYASERGQSESKDQVNSYQRSNPSCGSSEAFHSGSEDEEIESDFDDDQSFAGSESSHEANNLSLKQEPHIGSNGYHGSHLSRLQQQSAAGLHQPLHIPHFPHPLAMHYFPMNSHFLQQTSRFQQNSQQVSNRESPPNEHVKSGSMSSSHRKRRTRVFIDPMSEIPKLEKWFAEDTHPSSYMIDKYCEELNKSEYRQKFPKLEAKNVQLWFKNHRAKVKRMRVSSVDLHNMAEYRMEKC